MAYRKFTIRPAGATDLESLMGLLRELFELEEDFNPNAALQSAGLKRLLGESDAVILVAECSGKVIGMCTLQTIISTAEGGPAGLLEDMIVIRSARRQGIGMALLENAERWAKERGLTRLQLLAEFNNVEALSFYNKIGWQKTGLIGLRKILKLNEKV